MQLILAIPIDYTLAVNLLGQHYHYKLSRLSNLLVSTASEVIKNNFSLVKYENGAYILMWWL